MHLGNDNYRVIISEYLVDCRTQGWLWRRWLYVPGGAARLVKLVYHTTEPALLGSAYSVPEQHVECLFAARRAQQVQSVVVVPMADISDMHNFCPQRPAGLLLVFPLLLLCSATKPGFPASLKPGCLPTDPDNTDLFCPGSEGYGCYKIPTILKTVKGTLLAMIEARKYSCDDHGFVDLRLRRSLDGGRSWEPSQLMYSNSTEAQWTTVGDGNWVQDSATGTIWLLHTRNNSQLFLSSSSDDGKSWSEPIDVSLSLKHNTSTGAGTGHAAGIQLSAGPTKGRLIIPTYSGGVYIVYSDDHGKSWHKGSGTVPGETYLLGTSAQEWTVAETGTYTDDGTPILLASVRNSPNIPEGITGKGYRLQSLSRDSGDSWGPVREIKSLPEPIRGCNHYLTASLSLPHRLTISLSQVKVASSGTQLPASSTSVTRIQVSTSSATDSRFGPRRMRGQNGTSIPWCGARLRGTRR